MSEYSHIHEDAFNLLCDERIGYGMSRDVFTSRLLPDCVIKIEKDPHRFQNVVEWETWQRVRDTKVSRWFAACRWISPNGRVLVMERTERPDPDGYPSRMPAFLSDFKRTNYGLSMLPDPKTGRPAKTLVCHDYGTNMLFEHGMTRRMAAANWWDE